MSRRAFALLLLAMASVPARADEPKPMPGETPAVDPERLREAILKDMQAVEKKLKESDPGGDTRSIQSRILENLDKLLEQAGEPPPPSGDSSQKSESSQGGANVPQPGAQEQSGPGRTRRERREAERRRRQQQQQTRSGGGQQSPGTPGQRVPMAGSAGPAGQPPISTTPRPDAKAEAMADVAKDIWGHLPESMRQEVDRYYRVQFMPRYRDLIEQYYLRLAETERRKKDGRP